MKLIECIRRIEELDNMINTTMKHTSYYRSLLQNSPVPIYSDMVICKGNSYSMESINRLIIESERKMDTMVDELVDLKRELVTMIKQLNYDEESDDWLKTDGLGIQERTGEHRSI